MLTEYIRAAMKRAQFESLDDEGFFGTIPGFEGLWANAPTIEECREELQSTLEDWLLLSIARHMTVPVIDSTQANRIAH